MASFNVEVEHKLGREPARERVAQFLENVQRDYASYVSNVMGQWSENRLEFRFLTSGLSISGVLLVEESLVAVSGPLPLAAALFRGQIERSIRDELRKLLS